MPAIETQPETLTPQLLQKIDAYWRAANYLSVGQIYLYDNPLLKRPLAPGCETHAAGTLGHHPRAELHIYGDNLPEIRNWKWA